MRRVEDVYQVEAADGSVVRIRADLDETADGMERTWPGAGRRYRAFVARVSRIHERLRPLLTSPRPGPAALVGSGAWRDLPFLLRSLRSVLAGAGLPRAVADAVAIWTHVAGQTTAGAPSPLAFVTAILHGVGAFLPLEGIGAIPAALTSSGARGGRRVRSRGDRRGDPMRRGVGCAASRRRTARSSRPTRSSPTGTAWAPTWSSLADAMPVAARRRLECLPLQSPGVCAYLAVRGGSKPPYLRFHLPGRGELCRLLVTPAAVLDGPRPRRLGAGAVDRADGLRRGAADRAGAASENIWSESWPSPGGRRHVGEARVLHSRTPTDWGAACHLYRQSMNPVMTARFMRAGRLAHRSPFVERLYLSGSATHPGQWVSFCAISGVLAADRVLEDLT